jgi:hypothetical protein
VFVEGPKTPNLWRHPSISGIDISCKKLKQKAALLFFKKKQQKKLLLIWPLAVAASVAESRKSFWLLFFKKAGLAC